MGSSIWAQGHDTSHLKGTAHTGAKPRYSVVDVDWLSWRNPNLYVCDGLVLPTVGGLNLTHKNE